MSVGFKRVTFFLFQCDDFDDDAMIFSMTMRRCDSDHSVTLVRGGSQAQRINYTWDFSVFFKFGRQFGICTETQASTMSELLGMRKA
jgi:hypothetical protein